MASDPDNALLDRVALVTGASRGIGRAVALELARRGAHVIAVARTVGALEELDDEIRRSTDHNATLVPLDLKDGNAIDRLGASIFQRWKKLDILIGNAGILGPLTPIAHINPKDWQDLVEINVTANYRLIRSCDPLLRQSDAGRAVFITSGAAVTSRSYWGGYAVSKAALEMLARTYAEETSTTSVRVNLFNPGPTRTVMRAKAMPGEDPSTLPRPEAVAREIVDVTLPSWTKTGERISYSGLTQS
jgi:NAD(P)-dependent dehydrogenase (short-subunit alcohol dehydrogenase family)